MDTALALALANRTEFRDLRCINEVLVVVDCASVLIFARTTTSRVGCCCRFDHIHLTLAYELWSRARIHCSFCSLLHFITRFVGWLVGFSSSLKLYTHYISHYEYMMNTRAQALALGPQTRRVEKWQKQQNVCTILLLTHSLRAKLASDTYAAREYKCEIHNYRMKLQTIPSGMVWCGMAWHGMVLLILSFPLLFSFHSLSVCFSPRFLLSLFRSRCATFNHSLSFRSLFSHVRIYFFLLRKPL